jgi:TM2 domain-containing membrane protein YozV
MNCYLHPDVAAVAFCRSCGRPLCSECQRPAEGTVFCQEHVPIAAGPSPANPYVQPLPSVAPVQTSPGLAFFLGLIPGVGSIYNGQYLKGLVHAVIFGLLVSLSSSADNTAGQPFLVMMTMAFYFYMPFEAFHTAKKRQMGLPIDEWSSLISQRRLSSRVPIGPIVLILIGVLFLLDSLHLFDLRQVGRFWPVILIVIGAGMLYSRVTGPAVPEPQTPRNPEVAEASRER